MSDWWAATNTAGYLGKALVGTQPQASGYPKAVAATSPYAQTALTKLYTLTGSDGIGGTGTIDIYDASGYFIGEPLNAGSMAPGQIAFSPSGSGTVGNVKVFSALISGFDITSSSASWTQLFGTSSTGQDGTHLTVLQNGLMRLALDKTAGTSVKSLQVAFFNGTSWVKVGQNETGASHDWQSLTVTSVDRNSTDATTVTCTALNRNSSSKTFTITLLRCVPWAKFTLTSVAGSPSTWGTLSMNAVLTGSLQQTFLYDLPLTTTFQLRDIHGVVGANAVSNVAGIVVPVPSKNLDVFLYRTKDVNSDTSTANNGYITTANTGVALAIQPDATAHSSILGFCPRTYTNLATAPNGPIGTADGQLVSFIDWHGWEGETPYIGTELLTNGGFETDLSSWTQSSGTWARVTTQKKFGTASAQNTGAEGRLNQTVTTVVGDVYAVTGWIRTVNATVSGGRIILSDAAGTDSNYGTTAIVPAGQEWTYYCRVITATSTTLLVRLANDTATSGTVQYDGISVVKVKTAAGTKQLVVDTAVTTGWAASGGTTAVLNGVVTAPRGSAISATGGTTGGTVQATGLSPRDWSRFRYISAWVFRPSAGGLSLTVTDDVAGDTVISASVNATANQWSMLTWDLGATVRTAVTGIKFGLPNSTTVYVGHIRLSEHDISIGQKRTVWADMDDSLVGWWALDETTGTDGSNLITNPGFEGTVWTSPGAPPNWSNKAGNASQLTDETTTIRSGAHALKITNDGSGDGPGVTQTISGLTAGHSYYVEVYAQASGSGLAQLVINNVTDNVNVVATNTSTSGSWVKLSGTFYVVSGKTYAIHIFENSAVATRIAFFDDIVVKEIQFKDRSGEGNHLTLVGAGSVGPTENNSKVPNNGFETGAPDNWSDLSGGDATITRDTGIKRTGASSVKIVAGAVPVAAEGIGMSADIAQILAGGSVPMQAEVYARTAGVAGEQARLEVWNQTDGVSVATADGTAATTSFERLLIRWTTASGKQYRIRLMHTPTAATGDIVYFDDVFVVEQQAAGPTVNATGKINGAATFNGTFQTGYNAAPSAALLLADTDMTLEAWVSLATPSSDATILNGGSNGPGLNTAGWWFGIDTARKVKLHLATGAANEAKSSTAAISASTLAHVAAVYRSSTEKVRFFINGAFDSESTFSTVTVPVAGSYVTMGGDDAPTGAPNEFGAPITNDEVRKYNRALGDDEIAARFNLGQAIRKWTQLTGATLEQTTDKKEGTYAFKATRTGTGGLIGRQFEAPQDWSNFTKFSIWSKQDVSDDFSLRVYDQAGNRYDYTITGGTSYAFQTKTLASPDATSGTVDFTRIVKVDFNNAAGSGTQFFLDCLRLHTHVGGTVAGDWRYIAAAGSSAAYVATIGESPSTATLTVGQGTVMNVNVPNIGRYYVGIMASVDAGTPTLECYVDGAASGSPQTVPTTAFDVQTTQLLYGPFDFTTTGTHTIEARLATLSTATRLRLDFCALYAAAKTASSPTTALFPRDLGQSAFRVVTAAA